MWTVLGCCVILATVIRLLALSFLLLGLAACGAPTTTPTVPPTPTAPPSPTATVTPAPTAVPPTATVTPSSTPLPPTTTATAVPPTPTASATPAPGDLWLAPSDLRLHPDGDFYSGDLISFQVFAHHGHDWASSGPPDVDLQIWLGPPDEGELIVGDRICFYGRPDGENRLEWIWDTTGLAGLQTLSVVLDPEDEIQVGDENPDNNLVTRTIELRPGDELPAAWADAHWLQRTSECCVFHYISGTPAERDIEALAALADEAVAYAARQLGEEGVERRKLEVYLVGRVLGHGGFAGEVLTLSYLDRFYPGGELIQVFRHEGVHVLDRRFAQTRTALLSEGLAVYVAGGHFREEPLAERAAALLALDRYIPLTELANDFYPSQHEIGYLEAASFVGFLIDRFGWDAFKAFYSDMPDDQERPAAMIDSALHNHFGLTLGQAEVDWLATLQALPTPAAQMIDLRLSIDFYETVRRYQQAWDSSAHFLRVWLPELEEAERRGITADWIRHPAGEVNVTLETMLVSADRALDEGAYAQAESLLAAINAVLDAGGDLQVDPLAADYVTLVRATVTAGYQAQQIRLEGDVARVTATVGEGADTVELTFARRAGVWRLTSFGS